MFRSRGRKVWRDIWSRRGRTALAAISIFIGVLGVVILVTVGDLMIHQLREDLKEDELAMMQVFVTLPGGVQVDNTAYLEKLRALPGVTHVEGRANYPLFWKRPGDERFDDGFILAAWEPFEEIALQPLRPTAQGRYPVAGEREIAVEKRMADRYGLQVGDEMVLRILGGDSGDGNAAPEETWTIVGIVFQPYVTIIPGVGWIPNEASVFTAYEDARHIAAFTGFSTLYVRYTDVDTAEAQADKFLETLAQETPYVSLGSFIEDPAENEFIQITQQIANVLVMLALVAMVVSGFLVTNVINTIVVEQKKQIGVMKSLGASRTDSFMMYAGIALVYGVIGMLPGVLLGAFLGSKLAAAVAPMANSLIEGFRVSTLGVLLGVAMGLIVPVLAAIVPVFVGTRVSILEAMTDLGIAADYGRGLLARLIGALPLPTSARQALSNLSRKKGRLTLTGITLILAVASFMGVFGLFFSMNEIISDFFDSLDYQVSVIPNEGRDFEQVRALILGGVEEVEAVYPGLGLSAQIEGYVDPEYGSDQLFVTGFDPQSDMLALDLAAGTAWQDDPDREGIVLADSVARQLGKKVGDTVMLTVGGNSAELEIIGTTSSLYDQGFMEWRALAQLAGFTLGAPTPNEYQVLSRVEGYAGGQVVALGIDEQMASYMAPGASLNGDAPGVAISAGVAAEGNYQVGDELTLVVGANSATYPVAGIFELPPHMVPAGAPGDVVGLWWQELAALEGRDLMGEPVPNRMYVRMKQADPGIVEVDGVIDQIREVLLAEGITANYTNEVNDAELTAQRIMSLGMIFSITAAVMAGVGAIGLLATLSMSVFERQKEIGVMRSIGASSLTVAAQFLVEGILVGVIAWILGIPLSYLLSQVLASVLPFGISDVDYPPLSLLIGLVGMVVVATIASLWPSISAARKTVAQIIRYQ